MEFSNAHAERAAFGDWLISPLEGEMAGRPEGGVSCCEIVDGAPPSVAFGDISPSRGEIISFTVSAETPADIPARDALLDRAMGPRWRRKSSEKLRKGRIPSEGLALVARDEFGTVVGTVRLWDIAAGVDGRRSLLLGPLAVEPTLKSAGIGSALMREAIAEAARLGHAAVILVGDAPYYERFGFSARKTGRLAMPGPYEKHRLLALELVPGALDGAHGIIRPAGRKARQAHIAQAI